MRKTYQPPVQTVDLDNLCEKLVSGAWQLFGVSTSKDGRLHVDPHNNGCNADYNPNSSRKAENAVFLTKDETAFMTDAELLFLRDNCKVRPFSYSYAVCNGGYPPRSTAHTESITEKDLHAPDNVFANAVRQNGMVIVTGDTQKVSTDRSFANAAPGIATKLSWTMAGIGFCMLPVSLLMMMALSPLALPVGAATIGGLLVAGGCLELSTRWHAKSIGAKAMQSVNGKSPLDILLSHVERAFGDTPDYDENGHASKWSRSNHLTATSQKSFGKNTKPSTTAPTDEYRVPAIPLVLKPANRVML